MDKEMEKTEISEKKQAPKHIGRKLAAAITAATELFVPAATVLADGVPTPDKPTSVTGPAVPGKETTKQKEVEYTTVFDIKDYISPIFKTGPYKENTENKGLFEGPFKVIINDKDSSFTVLANPAWAEENYFYSGVFEAKDDFEIQFKMAAHDVENPKILAGTEFSLFALGPEADPNFFYPNFQERKFTGYFYMNIGKEKWDWTYMNKSEDKYKGSWPDVLKVPMGNNFRLRFENIKGEKPETVSIFDNNTNKLLTKFQMPERFLQTKRFSLRLHFFMQRDEKSTTTALIISHMQFLTPKNSDNLKYLGAATP